MAAYRSRHSDLPVIPMSAFTALAQMISACPLADRRSAISHRPAGQAADSSGATTSPVAVILRPERSYVAGATALNGGLTMDTSAFSVANTTGNTVISGTLTVTSTSALVGAVTANSTIPATGSITTQSSFFQDGVAFTGPLVGSTGRVGGGGAIAPG